jgi:hypothetical protein
MERSDFVKSMLALTGTAFVYGCKGVVEELSENYSSPTAAGAQEWFGKTYLGAFPGGRTQQSSVTRKLNWQKQQTVKSSKHDFIWVPVEYEGDEMGTAILMWKDGEEYVPQLAKYLSWSIAEGFLVYRKPNGDYDGFLAQLAFDPLKSHAGKPVDPNHFTGLVINADWNENILRSWRFLDGKLVSYYNPDAKKKSGRTQQCITTYTQYSSVTGVSCGPSCIDVTYTLHNVPHTTCYDDPYTGSDQGGYTGSGGYSPSGTGGGGYTPPVSPNWSPTYPYNQYNLWNVPNSPDRAEFGTRLHTALNVTGITTTVTGLTLDKATYTINTLGLEFQQVKIVSNFSKFGLGAIGAVAGIGGFAIGWMEDGWQWDEEGYNGLLAALGIVAFVGTGWVPIAAGAVSIVVIGVQAWDDSH